MFKDTINVVKSILEEYPKTRNNDLELIEMFLQANGYSTDIHSLPRNISLETITRARRKVQEQNVHLRATEKSRKNRLENQEDILTVVMDRGPANG